MQVCPVCNGMASLAIQCRECGKTLEDQGHVSDYYSPYSPYEEDYWPQLTGRIGKSVSLSCIHFLYCPNCRKSSEYVVNKVSI